MRFRTERHDFGKPTRGADHGNSRQACPFQFDGAGGGNIRPRPLFGATQDTAQQNETDAAQAENVAIDGNPANAIVVTDAHDAEP